MTSLDELEALLKKMSDAPWIDPPSRGQGSKPCPYLASMDGNNEVIVGRFDYASEFDKPGIAALRNAASSLIAAAREGERMREALDEADKTIDAMLDADIQRRRVDASDFTIGRIDAFEHALGVLRLIFSRAALAKETQA